MKCKTFKDLILKIFILVLSCCFFQISYSGNINGNELFSENNFYKHLAPLSSIQKISFKDDFAILVDDNREEIKISIIYKRLPQNVHPDQGLFIHASLSKYNGELNMDIRTVDENGKPYISPDLLRGSDMIKEVIHYLGVDNIDTIRGQWRSEKDSLEYQKNNSKNLWIFNYAEKNIVSLIETGEFLTSQDNDEVRAVKQLREILTLKNINYQTKSGLKKLKKLNDEDKLKIAALCTITGKWASQFGFGDVDKIILDGGIGKRKGIYTYFIRAALESTENNKFSWVIKLRNIFKNAA